MLPHLPLAIAKLPCGNLQYGLVTQLAQAIYVLPVESEPLSLQCGDDLLQHLTYQLAARTKVRACVGEGLSLLLCRREKFLLGP